MNKLMVFIYASLAMNIMNTVSVAIGAIFPLFLPKIVISIIVIALFLIFGLRLIWNVIFFKGNNDEAAEIEENCEKIHGV